MKATQPLAPVVALLALLLTAAPSAAQPDTPDAGVHPGIVSIDWGKHFGEREPTVTVNLSQAMLRFATAVASEAAKEITGVEEVIGQLHQIRVEVYQEVDPSVGLTSLVESEVAGLKSRGWETMVRAREGGNAVDVLVLPTGETFSGMVVIAGEGAELAFVNIAGDIDPETLGKHLGAIARGVSSGQLDLEKLLSGESIEEMIERSEKRND